MLLTVLYAHAREICRLGLRLALGAALMLGIGTSSTTPAWSQALVPESGYGSGLGFGGPSSVAPQITPPLTAPALAVVRDSAGRIIGSAAFTPAAAGVRVTGTFGGLSPGLHGIHIHEIGRCDAPSFSSAGGHYNPLGRDHGLLSLGGHHVGDLPNLAVYPNGVGAIDTLAVGATLSPGITSLFDANGSALIIHAQPDDQATDPAGRSGDRVACGVILPHTWAR